MSVKRLCLLAANMLAVLMLCVPNAAKAQNRQFSFAYDQPKTSGYGAGAGVINYAPAIDARGASVEAVARLAQVMEADRAAFATKTIAVIQQARRARVPGL